MTTRKQAVVALDFDHTLFDSDSFLSALADAALMGGVSKRQFYRTFEAVTSGHRDAAYDFGKHIETLRRTVVVDRRALSDAFDGVLERSADFLYRDTRAFLKRLGDWNLHLALLSFANPSIRFAQLRAARLQRAFHSIHVVNESRAKKVAVLRDVTAATPLSILVDDHPRVLEAAFGIVSVRVRVRRKLRTRYRNQEPLLPGVPVFTDLDGVYNFLLPMLRSLGRSFRNRRHR